MSASTRFISDLVGTLQSTFRVAGIKLANVSNTVLEIRDKAGTSFMDLRSRAHSFRLITGTNEIKLQIPSEPGANLAFNLPVVPGTTGQVLTTDGSSGTATLTWSTIAVASNQLLSQVENFVFNNSSPITIFTPPANGTIVSVTIEVDTAFDATGATIAVGVVGTTSKYMGTTDSDLTTAAVYEVNPMILEGASPAAVIATFSAGSGGTVGAGRVTVQYANPA